MFHLPAKSPVLHLLVDPENQLEITREKERIVIDLPDKAPDPVATVVILKLEDEPVAMPMASQGKTILASSEHAGSSCPECHRWVGS